MLCDRSRDQIISVPFAKFSHTVMGTGLSSFRVTNLVAKLGLELNMLTIVRMVILNAQLVMINKITVQYRLHTVQITKQEITKSLDNQLG